jgi:hypothetical protein
MNNVVLAVNVVIFILAGSLFVGFFFEKIYGFGRWYRRVDQDGYWTVLVGHAVIFLIFLALSFKI